MGFHATCTQCQRECVSVGVCVSSCKATHATGRVMSAGIEAVITGMRAHRDNVDVQVHALGEHACLSSFRNVSMRAALKHNECMCMLDQVHARACPPA
jgi:hypothetical protein